MKTIIKILLILTVLSSCTKDEDIVNIGLSIAYPRIFQTLEQAEKARSAKPIIAVLETDKGVFEFDLIDVLGGANTNTIQISPDTYKIIDLRLYDSNGKMTHQVHQGVPEHNSLVANWVNAYDYDLYKDRVIMWQVWLKE